MLVHLPISAEAPKPINLKDHNIDLLALGKEKKHLNNNPAMPNSQVQPVQYMAICHKNHQYYYVPLCPCCEAPQYSYAMAIRSRAPWHPNSTLMGIKEPQHQNTAPTGVKEPQHQYNQASQAHQNKHTNTSISQDYEYDLAAGFEHICSLHEPTNASVVPDHEYDLAAGFKHICSLYENGGSTVKTSKP